MRRHKALTPGKQAISISLTMWEGAFYFVLVKVRDLYKSEREAIVLLRISR